MKNTNSDRKVCQRRRAFIPPRRPPRFSAAVYTSVSASSSRLILWRTTFLSAGVSSFPFAVSRLAVCIRFLLSIPNYWRRLLSRPGKIRTVPAASAPPCSMLYHTFGKKASCTSDSYSLLAVAAVKDITIIPSSFRFHLSALPRHR